MFGVEPIVARPKGDSETTKRLWQPIIGTVGHVQHVQRQCYAGHQQVSPRDTAGEHAYIFHEQPILRRIHSHNHAQLYIGTQPKSLACDRSDVQEVEKTVMQSSEPESNRYEQTSRWNRKHQTES